MEEDLEGGDDDGRGFRQQRARGAGPGARFIGRGGGRRPRPALQGTAGMLPYKPRKRSFHSDDEYVMGSRDGTAACEYPCFGTPPP